MTSTRYLIFAPALMLMPAMAAAQSYPSKTVRVVVPFPAAGGTDILARVISPKVGEDLGQQIVVENRGGAGGAIGSELVAKAAPDGHTLLLTDTSFTTNPSLYSRLPYDSARDFAPVSLLASAPVILVVHPSLPARTVKEFVALAKSRPGQLDFGSGPGSSTHLAGELLKSVARVDLMHIPYKGQAPAVAALLGGHITMMFAGISSVKQHVAAGRLRAIAVTGNARSPGMPEVPTFVEGGLKGVDSGTYWGVLAPAATSREIVARLAASFASVLRQPDISQRLVELGFVPIGGSADQYAENLKAETEKWARVIRQAKVRLD